MPEAISSPERVRRWRQANPEKVRAARLKFVASYEAREGITPRKMSEKRRFERRTGDALFAEARKRARRSGFPFEIDVADVVIPDRCPVFKTPFPFEKTADETDPNAPSIASPPPAAM